MFAIKRGNPYWRNAHSTIWPKKVAHGFERPMRRCNRPGLANAGMLREALLWLVVGSAAATSHITHACSGTNASLACTGGTHIQIVSAHMDSLVHECGSVANEFQVCVVSTAVAERCVAQELIENAALPTGTSNATHTCLILPTYAASATAACASRATEDLVVSYKCSSRHAAGEECDELDRFCVPNAACAGNICICNSGYYGSLCTNTTRSPTRVPTTTTASPSAAARAEPADGRAYAGQVLVATLVPAGAASLLVCIAAIWYARRRRYAGRGWGQLGGRVSKDAGSIEMSEVAADVASGAISGGRVDEAKIARHGSEEDDTLRDPQSMSRVPAFV